LPNGPAGYGPRPRSAAAPAPSGVGASARIGGPPQPATGPAHSASNDNRTAYVIGFLLGEPVPGLLDLTALRLRQEEQVVALLALPRRGHAGAGVATLEPEVERSLGRHAPVARELLARAGIQRHARGRRAQRTGARGARIARVERAGDSGAQRRLAAI